MSDQKSNMIMTVCPNCQKKYKILNALVGKIIACKNCSHSFTIKAVVQPPQLPDLCRLAMFEKMLQREQVDYAVASYQLLKKAGSTLKFDHFFLSCGVFDSAQKKRLETLMDKLQLRRLGGRFCTIAIEKGLITQAVADQVLAKQAQQFKEEQAMELVGDLLVNDGHITPKERNQILVQQKRLSQDLIGGEDTHSQPQPPAEAYNTNTATSSPPQSSADTPPSNADDNTSLQQESDVPSPHPSDSSSIDDDPVNSPSIKEEKATEKERREKGISDAPSSVDEAEGTSVIENGVGNGNIGDEVLDKTDDAPFTLRVTEDKTQAIIEIQAGKEMSVFLSDVKAALKESGIVHGVLEDGVIDHFIVLTADEPDTSPHSLIVAKGEPAQPGKSAELNCFFETDYLKAGAKKADGSIDFMDRGERPFVSSGDLLLEKRPMAPASPGKDVYGYPIEVDPVFDIPLRCGKGAALSEDKLSVTATENGEPHLSFDGKISVLSEQRITGNIGLKTGHVFFDGNVVVSNTVKSGAKVRCANLTAAAIEDAEIDTTGDIRVTGGITGATIRTQGRVFARFISKCRIDAYGDVTAEKEIIDSHIRTSGTCRVTGGSVISSEVKSKQGIESIGVGTETSSPCLLHIGCDDHLESEISEIQDQIMTLEKEMADSVKLKNQLDHENQGLDQKIVSLAHVQDRGQLELKGLEDRLAALVPVITDGIDPDTGETMDLSSSSFEDFTRQIKAYASGAVKRQALEMVNQIQILRKKVNTADSDVTVCFERQDQIANELEAMERQFEMTAKKIEILKFKKETLKKRFKKEKSQGELVARQEIFSGTVIKGKNCRWVVDTMLKNVTLKEVKIRDKETARERWEIVVRQNR